MNKIKLISLLLALLMMMSAITSLTVLNVFAADTTSAGGSDEEEEKETDYRTLVYANPEEKLATMECKVTKGDYQLYVDKKLGEVALLNVKTGETLFTNPYDIGSSDAVESPKSNILSQIIVNYTDNDKHLEFNSYEMSALRNQIKVKNIKNGIRVEYTLGREEAKMLVPRWISVDRYIEKLVEPLAKSELSEFYIQKVLGFYTLKSLNPENYGRYKPGFDPAVDMKIHPKTGMPVNFISYLFCDSTELYEPDPEPLAEATVSAYKKAYPIVSKMDIMVCDPTLTEVQLARIEARIKTYCPEYTYEDLDYDHEMTEYQGTEENPPVFKLSLEYTLDETGDLTVRLPANGVRFDEDRYQLESIEVLPYMGAGSSSYDGYTFYPDGSGALFNFQEPTDKTQKIVSGAVYGSDFAYHSIDGTYQKVIRYPVFGIVEETKYYEYSQSDEETGETSVVRINGDIHDKVVNGSSELTAMYGEYILSSNYDVDEISVKKGFVAQIVEGEALSRITSQQEGAISEYNTVVMEMSPRPKDEYNLSDSISVGTNSPWTVVSKRKYVGNYKIKYTMLHDDDLAAENGLTGYYECSWMGMAKAYQASLVKDGQLSLLSENDIIGDNIPLYIESFGTLGTVKRFLSIPYDTMLPLTTFDDVKTMYDQLSNEGIKNINFKLTGFANGGLYPTVPYNLKWEKKAGGKKGFADLTEYAKEVAENGGNLGIYPEFDFVYMTTDGSFDGLNMRKHIVKTIDGRYASKREYSPTRQTYVGRWELAVSPAYFSRFYEKFVQNYLKYENVNGISVSTLGNSLNSDFDEDEPYNREDGKTYTKLALEYISDRVENVMVSGGNAFSWKYADHILSMPLDSSRYSFASYSVPFIGVVLHGYKQYAGDPLNMEGDIRYAFMKAIENGSSVYFTLSYRNTEILKQDTVFDKYYSVRYDYWFDDVVSLYSELNGVMSDVQLKPIIAHQFLDNAVRVPDADELKADIDELLETLAAYEDNLEENKRTEEKLAVSNARDIIRETLAEIIANVELIRKTSSDVELNLRDTLPSRLNSSSDGLTASYEAYAPYMDRHDEYASYKNSDDPEKAELYSKFYLAYKQYQKALLRSTNTSVAIAQGYTDIIKIYENTVMAIGECRDALNLVLSKDGIIPQLKQQTQNRFDEILKYFNEYKEYVLATGVEDFENTIEVAEAELALYKQYLADKVAYNLAKKAFESDPANEGSTYDVEAPVAPTIHYMVDKFSEKIYTEYLTAKAQAENAGETYTGEVIEFSFANRISVKESYDIAVAKLEEFYNYIGGATSGLVNREIIANKLSKGTSNTGTDEEITDDLNSKYGVAQGSIVAVTYGSDEHTPYKTMVLNYNNYLVTFTFEGREYTLGAHDYVIINR